MYMYSVCQFVSMGLGHWVLGSTEYSAPVVIEVQTDEIVIYSIIMTWGSG